MVTFAWRMVLFLLVALLAAPLFSAEFEVASVKPSDPTRPSTSTGIKTGKGRLTANELPLKRYLMSAYTLGQNQIEGGPEWVSTDRYDISAVAPPSGDAAPLNDDAEFMRLLRGLLTERFKLQLRHETKVTKAYVLSVAKGGAKLEKGDGGESNTVGSTGRIEAKNATMKGLAERLARQVDLPVVDKTGLDGKFNISLQWDPSDTGPDRKAENSPSIFTALQKLGLRMTVERVEVEMLFIDHAERPSEN
jgi:uncharacterized protein (TIGR03435 family)